MLLSTDGGPSGHRAGAEHRFAYADCSGASRAASAKRRVNLRTQNLKIAEVASFQFCSRPIASFVLRARFWFSFFIASADMQRGGDLLKVAGS